MTLITSIKKSSVLYQLHVFNGSCFYRPEPVVMEFPELKGHTRRDYWLAIIREVLYVHMYMNKFKIGTGVAKDEAISKAVLGILRVQAIQELGLTNPVRYENLLPFNLCDQLPGGDHILQTLAEMSSSRVLDRTNKAKEGNLINYTRFLVLQNSMLIILVFNRDTVLYLSLRYGFPVGFGVWNKPKE